MDVYDIIRENCKALGFRSAQTVESVLGYMVEHRYSLDTAIVYCLPNSYRWRGKLHLAAQKRLRALIEAGVLHRCQSVGGSYSAEVSHG